MHASCLNRGFSLITLISRILERCRELELAPTEEIGLAKSSYKREVNDKTLHPEIVN